MKRAASRNLLAVIPARLRAPRIHQARSPGSRSGVKYHQTATLIRSGPTPSSRPIDARVRPAFLSAMTYAVRSGVQVFME